MLQKPPTARNKQKEVLVLSRNNQLSLAVESSCNIIYINTLYIYKATFIKVLYILVLIMYYTKLLKNIL